DRGRRPAHTIAAKKLCLPNVSVVLTRSSAMRSLLNHNMAGSICSLGALLLTMFHTVIPSVGLPQKEKYDVHF
ncbi:MAG: hypothetical protein WD042_09680, partial [Phycisphaeraceae bacterium]